MEQLTATQWIAAYGAVVATASAAWNIHVGLRDRAVLRMRGDVREAHDSGRLGEPFRTVIHVAVSNAGRRPITVTGAGWQYEDGTFGFFVLDVERLRDMPPHEQLFWQNHMPRWPQTLGESAGVAFYLPIEAFGKGPPRTVHVNDSHGNVHRLPRRAAKKLARQVREAIAAAGSKKRLATESQLRGD